MRIIRAPSDELKAIQRQIVKQVFAEYELHPSAHGGVKKRSTRTNAQLHMGQKCVVNLDARRFYPSVSHHRVYALLVRGLGIGRDAASLITRLVTYDGQLIQGAPTSSVIANLLLQRPVDEPISTLVRGVDPGRSPYTVKFFQELNAAVRRGWLHPNALKAVREWYRKQNLQPVVG